MFTIVMMLVLHIMFLTHLQIVLALYVLYVKLFIELVCTKSTVTVGVMCRPCCCLPLWFDALVVYSAVNVCIYGRALSAKNENRARFKHTTLHK